MSDQQFLHVSRSKIPAVANPSPAACFSVWHKNDGDSAATAAGDALFTLETDKVWSRITAEKAGTLGQSRRRREIKVGEVVAAVANDAPAASKADQANADDKNPTPRAPAGTFGRRPPP